MKILGFIFLLGTILLVEASRHSIDIEIQSTCANNAKRLQSEIKADRESWEATPWKRVDIIKYVRDNFEVDTNKDELISVEELQAARVRYLPAFLQTRVESNEIIFRKCDCDGDGFISEQDFLLSYMTCLKDARIATFLYKIFRSYFESDASSQLSEDMEIPDFARG